MPATAEDLAEFRTLTTNYGKSPALIRRAIRTLLEQQFIFADDRGGREIYAIIADYDCTGFFEAYFSCAGYELIVDRSRHMIAVLPPAQTEEQAGMAMRIDETITILLCKARFDEAILQSARLEEGGGAAWHTDALHDQWRAMTGREPPGKTRMIEILRQLKQRNLIGGTIPPSMGDGIEFTVRPSVALAVTVDATQQLINRAARAGAVDEAPPMTETGDIS